mgnify:CR=1 FL=1
MLYLDFSGAGKGTLMKHLLEKYDNYALSISATTEHRERVKNMEESTSSIQNRNLKN